VPPCRRPSSDALGHTGKGAEWFGSRFTPADNLGTTGVMTSDYGGGITTTTIITVDDALALRQWS